MKNEPVAWMRYSDKAVCSLEEKRLLLEEEGTDWGYKIPLYDKPSSLTDSEILNCLEKADFPDLMLSNFAKEKMKIFARAILRKAQEND